ncbi:MAG: 2OG-Fe(II) oxygenase [Burkholderiaceae bacterium]
MAPNTLPPQWQDWIAENLARGCRETDMVSIMADNGFARDFALSAISVMRDMSERVKSGEISVPGGSGYLLDPIRIPATGQVDVGDRLIDIGFVMTDPNVALIENLIAPDECEALIEASRGKLKRSEVVNRETGAFEVNSVRTSAGTHFARGENELVTAVEERIARLTGIPVDHGEPLQVLYYQVGGEYLPHQDFFEPTDPGSAVHMEAGGQRVATLVMYLNTVPGGGETEFPKLALSVKARQGCGVYFEYTNQHNHLDSRCLHAGVPVAEGEKWIVTKWLRQRPYVRPAA